jgi:hypothetical protein
MEEASVSKKGPIEGSSRILRELLRSPRFKQTMNILLREMDPENVSLLVRTLVHEDPDFFLSLLGATPSLINVGMKGLVDTTKEMLNFPPELLEGFLTETAEELDAEQIGEAAGLALLLTINAVDSEHPMIDFAGRDFAARFRKGLASSVSGEADSVAGALTILFEKLMPVVENIASRMGSQAARGGSDMNELIDTVVDGIKAMAGRNPEFMKLIAAPLIDAGRHVLADAESPDEAAGEAD